jgi:glutamate-ammonia-ligase adenylyltransferase
LRANVGNIALLQHAEAVGLLPLGVGQSAARAYRTLRRLQHRARLDEAPTQMAPDGVAAEQLAIQNLWACVFNAPPKA